MKFSSITDVGNVREINEDDYYIDSQTEKLFMVADGMGGHKAGDVASKMVINILKNHFLKNINENMELVEIKNKLLEGIKIANKEVYKLSSKYKKLNGMGTTLNLLYIGKKDLLFLNAGDSRSYIYYDSKLQKITKDHSLVEQLLSNGTITENEAKNHPQRNIITSCLGNKKDYKIDSYIVPKRKNMKILLCTDGLTNLIKKEEIKETIENNNVYLSSKKLVDLAKKYGGFDNITLILLSIESNEDENEKENIR
ncbi:MAG: Stp1/IreP family PP2C-type Ser/Thr phosphatase [Bacillota bacterium]